MAGNIANDAADGRNAGRRQSCRAERSGHRGIAHRFWTEIVGLKQVGALRPQAEMGPMPAMRFYSGDHGGKMAHHDVAIVENPNLPPPPKNWELFGAPQAINHIAIAMPDRETC